MKISEMKMKQTFSAEEKLRKFIATRPAVKESPMEVIQIERK